MFGITVVVDGELCTPFNNDFCVVDDACNRSLRKTSTRLVTLSEVV